METNIPKYFLYGDGPQDVELDFVQSEPIRRRSGAHNWIISPHSHPHHMQFLLISKGGGLFRMDDESWTVKKNSLILVPSGCVHEMTFSKDTDGYVITAATNYISSISGNDHRLLTAIQHSYISHLSQETVDEYDVVNCFERIHKEFVWTAKGRRVNIMCYLTNLLVTFMRLQEDTDLNNVINTSREQQIVMRFREEIEQHYRTEKTMAFYYNKIGVSSSRLHDACREVTGMSPSTLLHDRIIIESKRLILYSAATIAEIGYKLGFEDPAYFARFFTKRVGTPPSKFRQQGNRKASA